MYEPLFDLRKRPFPAIPQADSYFPGEAIEAARMTLVRCIRRAEGSGLVIGPSGTGKTTLCHVLARELGEQLRVVFLASGRLGSRRAILQAILYELGQSYRGMDEGEARLALADYITLSKECPNGILLLVDEAHTLPLRLLDEVRMTTNLAHNGKPWVRVVLVGGCALEERFASPKLDSFSQRITARCYLESLGAAETQQYVWAQVAMAGGRGESLFPEAACKAVYRATDGVPRLINQVCDHALLLACAAGHRAISPGHVEEAWADLQQLPTPWNGEDTQSGGAHGVVEFGRLDDEDEAPSAARRESSDTIPLLRISAADEFADGESEIEGRVDLLEQMLDQAENEDADFQPAGSIGPEVELHFAASWNPFSEEFADEEIVDDRRGQVDQPVLPTAAAPFAASSDVAASAPGLDEPLIQDLEDDAFELEHVAANTDLPPSARTESCAESSAQATDAAVIDAQADVHRFATPAAEPAWVPADQLLAEPAATTAVQPAAAELVAAQSPADEAAAAESAEAESAEAESVEAGRQVPEWSVLDGIEAELAREHMDSQPARTTIPCRPVDETPRKYSRLFATLRHA